MIMPDANLLIYSVNQDMELHHQAKAWWEDQLSGQQIIGIPWVVLMAFIRINTHRRIFPNPLTPAEAIGYVDDWLSRPVTRLVSPGEQHWLILRNLIEQTGTAGNLTTDAHIAALAIEQGYVVYSADNDFKRFPGLKHINPLGFGSADRVHETAGNYSAS
ncbi:MAG: type II toxin-antitoxin system VapC family toxin [Thiolinea sp.]